MLGYSYKSMFERKILPKNLTLRKKKKIYFYKLDTCLDCHSEKLKIQT